MEERTLFSVQKSKKDQLRDFFKARRFTKSSEVLAWGTRNFCNRADRYARDFAAKGLLRRVSDDLKERLFGRISEDVWETVQ